MGPRRRLSLHLKQLNDGKVYTCCLCTLSFSTYRRLHLHLKEHPVKTLEVCQCTHCKKRLANRRSFLRHMREYFKWHRDATDDKGIDDENIDLDMVDDSEKFSLALPTKGSKYKLSIPLAVAQFISVILSSGKISLSQWQNIAANANVLINVILENILTDFKNEPYYDHSFKTKILKYQDPCNIIPTKYKLDKLMKNEGFLVPSKEITLDSDLYYRNKKQVQLQVFKPIKMQYVSIKSNLISIFKIPGMLESILTNQKRSNELTHYRDARQFKDEDPNVVLINIYYDDIETCNPLGSKAGKQKLAMFYMSIIDMPAHMLGQKANYFLLASLKTEDFKLLKNANSVMKTIVDELKDLWVNGLSLDEFPVSRDLGIQGSLKTVKVRLAQLVGDNLGLHTVLGFSEGFTANFPCRRCRKRRDDCQVLTEEDKASYRNEENYAEDVRKNSLSETGIKYSSVLNELPYHHVTKMIAFDIMHDVLEGVAPDYLRQMFNSFFSSSLLTLEQLNLRIKSFKYGKHFIRSKPSAFRETFFKSDTHSGQNSGQMMTVLLVLPLMICELIPPGNEFWNGFLILRDIFIILISQYINRSALMRLNLLIKEFLESYKTLTDKTFKPKHHHMTHYVTSIQELGPLRQYWCMTFESVHRFFKSAAINCSNFLNVPKSVSYRFQLQKSFQNMNFYFHGVTAFSPFLKQNVSLSETKKLQALLCVDLSSKELYNIPYLEYKGNEYVKNCYLYLGIKEYEHQFGNILSIYNIDENMYFLLRVFTAQFDKQLGAFLLCNYSHVEKLIKPEDVEFYMPLYPMRCNVEGKQQSNFIIVPCWIH